LQLNFPMAAVMTKRIEDMTEEKRGVDTEVIDTVIDPAETAVMVEENSVLPEIQIIDVLFTMFLPAAVGKT